MAASSDILQFKILAYYLLLMQTLANSIGEYHDKSITDHKAWFSFLDAICGKWPMKYCNVCCSHATYAFSPPLSFLCTWTTDSMRFTCWPAGHLFHTLRQLYTSYEVRLPSLALGHVWKGQAFSTMRRGVCRNLENNARPKKFGGHAHYFAHITLLINTEYYSRSIFTDRDQLLK